MCCCVMIAGGLLRECELLAEVFGCCPASDVMATVPILGYAHFASHCLVGVAGDVWNALCPDCG